MAEEKKMTWAQRMGIARTVVRPSEDTDLTIRDDRIGRYFRKYLDKFAFVEFSDEYLEKAKMADLMKGVPIPLRREDLKKFEGGEGLQPNLIGENMAWVMGSDPKFKYTKTYVEYLKRVFNNKVDEAMMKEGRDAAEKEEYDSACIHFRASLCINPTYLHSMYSYARVCRAMYMESDDPEYTGRFKAESLEWLELLTDTHPRFANGYYYLGYAYLNMGLYGKADATWRRYLNFAKNGKDRREINKRLKQIADPVKIEGGCNAVSAGRMKEGLDVLEPYLNSQFKDWWPLHFYTGLAYKYTNQIPQAVARFRQVLLLNGSHLDTMRELVEIYKDQGDKENVTKFTKKIEMIEAQLQEEAEEEAANAPEEKEFHVSTGKQKEVHNTSKKKLEAQKLREKEEKKAAKMDSDTTKAGIRKLK